MAEAGRGQRYIFQPSESWKFWSRPLYLNMYCCRIIIYVATRRVMAAIIFAVTLISSNPKYEDSDIATMIAVRKCYERGILWFQLFPSSNSSTAVKLLCLGSGHSSARFPEPQIVPLHFLIT